MLTRHGSGGWGLVLVLAAAIPVVAQQTPSPQVATNWTEEQLKRAVAPVRAGRVLTPKSWPNGARVAVCISFDVDNETWVLARGETAPVPLSAGEFGALTAFNRVLGLLDRHQIPASFYVPAVSAVLHPHMLPEIVKRGRHEVALHGWVHENLLELNDRAEEERLLRQSIDLITKATGRRPVGYRAPSWVFSRHTLDLLRDAGLLYDSSLMARDEPYELLSNDQSTGLVELPVDWGLDDAPFFGRAGALPDPERVFQAYRDDFDAAYADGTMFMLTLHPQVIGRRATMMHLDRLITHIKTKPGVWFATGEQIAQYVKKTAGLGTR